MNEYIVYVLRVFADVIKVKSTSSQAARDAVADGEGVVIQRDVLVRESRPDQWLVRDSFDEDLSQIDVSQLFEE